jgi:hypothetical protein
LFNPPLNYTHLFAPSLPSLSLFLSFSARSSVPHLLLLLSPLLPSIKHNSNPHSSSPLSPLRPKRSRVVGGYVSYIVREATSSSLDDDDDNDSALEGGEGVGEGGGRSLKGS